MPAAEECAESGEPDLASKLLSKDNGLNHVMTNKLADAVGKAAGACCVSSDLQHALPVMLHTM